LHFYFLLFPKIASKDKIASIVFQTNSLVSISAKIFFCVISGILTETIFLPFQYLLSNIFFKIIY